MASTKIVSFQNMSDFTHQVDSVVPMDEPLFKATPSEIRFANFESLQNLDATLNLRNQDNVARRVKILQPDSTFFKVLPGKGRKPDQTDNKVAPGMEVSYIVRFTPDQQVEDYSYDLVVITERERFIVPIRATGGGALLDMPDEVDFGLSPVKYEAPKTIMVRNVGEKPTKFLLKVPAPFSSSIQDGYLEVGEIMQVDVVFRPDKAEPYEREMLIIYGDGVETYVTLRGRAENVNVTFSATQLQLEDTFIALSTQKTIVIHNNSEIPVDFSWRAFPSIQEEISQKLKLQVQLKQEEAEEASAIQDLRSSGSIESDVESLSESSDEYNTRGASLRDTEMAQGALQRRYKNIAKAILEDPMFFYDEIFAVEPLSGRIWAKSKIAITFTFTPKAALNYQCLAYCSVVGRAERLPLLLKGTGIGPKAAFSYDELDVGDIFVESVHQYEVNLINQGDIDVEFRLVPNPSPFGSIFTFTPSDGCLEVGGECTIVVEVCPDLLGEFQEVFYWELVGSTSKIGLSFRGHSVSPTFHFDLDRISFGVVSYGFLNSKTLTLTNTSEVPMRFALRIPGDGRFTQREFDVIPPKGTLLPNCAQKVQIDFVSMNVKSYDLCLVVDLDGVGQELASIPIQARCAVPQVALEPAEHVDYGDIFIRYPSHQTMVLNNTSALPAKFQIMPQDESTRAIAEFEPDQSFGSVPPSSSHVLTFTLTSQVIGTLQIPITLRILGQNSARNLILIANTIGPIVTVEPNLVDWGNAHCLEAITRSVLVSNNSVIPASIRCIMKSKNSLWTLSPKAMELPPHGSSTLNMTLTIDEVAKMTDTVHVIVHESNDVAVTVRAKGIGTPVMCRESLEVIDFGTQYTTQTHSKEFVIENRGRQPRKLVWTLESTEAKRKERKLEEGDVPVFSVVPDTLLLDGKCAFRFIFNASSPRPGSLVDTLTCNELCGDDRKGKTIFKAELSGNFVLPILQLSATSVSFRYLWERHCPLHPLSEPLVLKNISPLEVRFFIKVQPPFYVNVDTVFLRPHEDIEIRVEFDPAFKVDRVCGTVKQKLSIVYQDHPQRDHVGLIGEVIFPNLTLGANKLDFGSVLNETTKQMTITMGNPNALPVNYQWSFVEDADLNDEELARREQSTGTSAFAGTLMSPGNSHTSGFNRQGSPSAPSSVAPEGHRTSVSQAPKKMSMKPALVDINQIFDILPIMGTLEPGHTQDITFTYYGMRNQKFDVTAVCQTEGGPEYEVALKGQASKLDFYLDKTELDFGEVPYTEVQEREVLLVNTGKVAFQYSWNLCALSRPSVLDCWPIAGEIKAGDKERITIRFRPGIPDEVAEVALLEVAHFERQRIHVRGHGIFPGIILLHGGGTKEKDFKGLERWEEQEHQTNKELALQRLLTNGPPPLAACVSNSSSSVPAASVDETDEISGEETQWQPEAQLIEFEVDRHFICETLLSQEKDLWKRHLDKHAGKEPMMKIGRGSARNKADWRPMLELPPVTAAYYCCNFGHIVLGHSGKRVISVYNCFHENVNFNIGRKVLMQHGFQISPEKVSKVLPGKKVKLELTCFRDRTGEEGKQETTWIIPVRGGPSYEVKLVSEFVRPDLELSYSTIDFGHVPVGQVKRITMKLRNVKPVVVSWDYKLPTDKFGKALECAYLLEPRAGRIAPGEIQFVTVSFTPTAANYFNQKLALRIVDNPNRKQLHLKGHGDGLYVELEPSDGAGGVRLGPVLPGTENCIQELFLVNPTEYTIEVYSVDFDSRYKEEEYFLQVYDQYQNDRMELPLRPPGALTWPHVAKHGRRVKRLEMIREREMREQQKIQARERAVERVEAAKKQVELAASSEDPEVPEKANQELQDAEAAVAEIDAMPEEEPIGEESEEEVGEVDEEPQPEMDPKDFPYRVVDEDRLHALIIGSSVCGKTTLARHLSTQGRKVTSLDEVVDWALSGPPSLHGPEEETRRERLRRLMTTTDEEHEQSEKDREKAATKAKEQFVPLPVKYALPMEDVVHFLKARMLLPDCNACLVFDGLSSKYLPSIEQTATAIFTALWPQRVTVLAMGCDAYGDAAMFGEGAVAKPPPEELEANDEVGKLRAYYGALKAQLVPLQEALHAAEAELKEVTTKLQELEERKQKRAEETAAAGAEAAAEATEETAEILVESAATLDDPEAAEEALLRESLKAAELNAKSAKAKVEELEGQLERCRSSMQQLEKSEGSEESLIEQLQDTVTALESAAAQVLESQRPKVETQDESGEGAGVEGQPDAETEGAAGAPAEAEQTQTPPEKKKVIKPEPQPTATVQFVPLPLETTFEACDPADDFPTIRAACATYMPPPLIPKEPAIPPPSLAQVVERPQLRLPRPAVTHFQLQTPPEETTEEGDAAAAAATAAATGGGRTESKKPQDKTDKTAPPPATEEPVEQPTRWLIKPKERVRLLLKFFSEEIGNYQSSLGFEVVGGTKQNAHVSIDVTGITTFPGISSDPRNVFMRRVKTKPASGYASKQYIASTGVFDFGPLLAGRSANDAPDDASEQFVKQHIEQFRITNNSMLKADVAFSLASAKVPEDPKAKPGGKNAAAPNPLEEFPFTIEPKQLELEVGETKELSVSCFPVKEGTYSDTIVANITDNPEPVEFQLAAIGALPKVTVDVTELDFDRLLVKQKASQSFKVSNVTAIPVKWQFQATPPVPEGFDINFMEGVLGVAEERIINVVFKSDTACTHKFKLLLQISDTENFGKWEAAGEIAIAAEAFVVDVLPQFPEDGNALDMGDVRVGATVEKTFQVVNNGKYAVNFELQIRRKSVRELLQIDYGIPLEEGKLPELQPGQKLPIKATATPLLAMQFPDVAKRQGKSRSEELELLVYDSKTGGRVQVETPLIPLILRAVYNSLSLTPTGLDFGPVKMGESGTRELEICNNGPFKFDWFFFDAEGEVKKPDFTPDPKKPAEVPDFVLGDFKLSPGSGSLEPQAIAKIVGTFAATEPKNWQHKLGIHVPGLPEDGSDAGIQRGEGEGDTLYKECLLAAQSATPGIDAANVHSIFEEHYVAPTLDDAIAFAGRSGIRAFDEEARYFSFGPVPALHQGSPETPEPARFRITNPNPIACDVKFEIKPTVAPTGKEVPVLPFELSSKELHIPAHEYRYIKVRFSPQALQRYSAIFEATVPEGKDPKTNSLKFELRGDGAMPSIALSGPTVFGDNGGQYDFGKGRVGKRHLVEFTLYNQGEVPATARFELTAKSSFSLSCPRRTTLDPKASQKFQVLFCPMERGDLTASLRLQTMQNPYEDTRVTFVGHGYVEEVAWELPEVVGDEEDILNLGEVCIGNSKVATFHISNATQKMLRFQFRETLPAPLEGVEISPSLGHVLPGMKKQITFTYKPTAAMKADVQVPVQIASIIPEEEEDWDNGWHSGDQDADEARSQVDPEPVHSVVDGSSREMPLRTIALADQISYECAVERIYFSSTVLFQSRLYRFAVTNPSSIALPYSWRVVPAEEKERTGLLPYSITPPKGIIAAGSTAEFEIRFAPKEVEDFAALLDSRMPLQEPLRIPLNGSALRPWCHFEVPVSDYRAMRQAADPLDPKYEIIECESMGVKVRNVKRFYVLNPTSDPYEFQWTPEEPKSVPSAADQTAVHFRCLTKRGTILPGKKFEMLFEYLPTDPETHESRWVFSVAGKEASQSFLLVGTVKEPKVGFDVPCIKFKRLLVGGKTTEKVHIINKENLPLNFAFDRAMGAVRVSPKQGVIGPGESLAVDVRFQPTEEKFYNVNVVCNIKRKQKPLLLNIKGEGYQIHTQLVVEEADSEGRELRNNMKELLDFGDVQVEEKKSFTLKLSSPSKIPRFDDEQLPARYYFLWQLRNSFGRVITLHSEKPPYLSITPEQGVITQDSETTIIIEYSPMDLHKLDGATLQMRIPSGPEDTGYNLTLGGRSFRPPADPTLTEPKGDTEEGAAKDGNFPYEEAAGKKPSGLPGLAKTIIFKAPLGSTDCSRPFRFHHFTANPATFTATVEAAPGQKAVTLDFVPEAKEVKAEAAGPDGVEVCINVRFQPSALGEIRALLVMKSDIGGHKALLVGYAQPPQPQGPVDIAKGKPTNVDFQNPFMEPVEFSLQVDDPCFQLTQRAIKLDGKKTAPIPVSFAGDRVQQGRLLISAPNVSVPWVIFLQGNA